ncbi:unnamed protein product [Lampetra fluviatilis]
MPSRVRRRTHGYVREDDGQQRAGLNPKGDRVAIVLARARRANNGLEELRKGNLERECMEERCSFEEAREVFENIDTTVRRLPSARGPTRAVATTRDTPGAAVASELRPPGLALPAGRCFVCRGDSRWFDPSEPPLSVPRGFVAADEIDPATFFPRPESRAKRKILLENDSIGLNQRAAWPHVVDPPRTLQPSVKHSRVLAGSDEQFSCSCAKDYKLLDDGKSCQPVVPFPCGRIQVQVQKPRSKREASSVTVETPVQPVPPHSTVSDNSSYIAEGSEADLRIAGGEECPLGECPWQGSLAQVEHPTLTGEELSQGEPTSGAQSDWKVLILDKKGEGICGGTILNREWVLTAAHCIPYEPDIVVGEHNRTVSEPTEQKISIKQMAMHNRFSIATNDNDIALLRMSEPIKFNKYVLPACLPEPDFADNVLKEELARISGWGILGKRRLKAEVLQTSFVPYQDMARCKESSSYTITKNMFCAGYSDSKTDACQGESGGPHVTPYANTWFSTGIISWGEGCNRKGKFGIYARVSRYLPWIDTVMKNYSVYKDEIPTAGRNLRRSRQN